MLSLGEIGKWLMLSGVGLLVLGGLLWLIGRGSLLGHLPGDLHFQVGNVSCFVPLATMLLLSLLATVILNIVVRLLNK
jgi:hypothetical protein